MPRRAAVLAVIAQRVAVQLIVAHSAIRQRRAGAPPPAEHLRVCQLAAWHRTSESFCSSGRLQGYAGPLDTAAQLRAALAATAFRGEVVVFAETRVHDASQTLARFRNAGYSHVLAVMEEAAQCQRLSGAFEPWRSQHGPISCGVYATSDSSGNPYAGGMEYLRRGGVGDAVAWRKWFTVARAVALGYNVMAADADAVVLGDFYWRVKQPPLASYNFITLSDGYHRINPGFVYIQNASSSGPIAWMLQEVVHRVVRWSEDPSVLFSMSPLLARDGVIPASDQESLSDLLWACLTGQPRFGVLTRTLEADVDALASLGFASLKEWEAAMEPHVVRMDVRTYDALSPELSAVVCETLPEVSRCQRRPAYQLNIRSAELRMPHSGGTWPKALGGYPFNREVGPITRAFRQAFKDLGVPLPPDPEDPSTQHLARATAPALFGLMHTAERQVDAPYAMGWLHSTWFSSGRLGLWHLHLRPPPFQAMGRIQAGVLPGDFQRTVILQATGLYDWHVAERLSDSPKRVFIANHGARARDSRLVVAYAPGVIRRNMTKEEFLLAVQGLAHIAVTLGAIVAWPAAPCDGDWARFKASAEPPASRVRLRLPDPRGGPSATSPAPVDASVRHVVPWYHLDTRYSVVPFGDSLDTLQCLWPGFSFADCLANRMPGSRNSGQGMLPTEFAHLLRQHAEQLRAEQLAGADTDGGPHSKATSQPRHEDIGTRLVLERASQEGAQSEAVGAFGLMRVQYKDLLTLNAERVLQLPASSVLAVAWVDRAVERVVGMRGQAEKTYQAWSRTCPALKYYNLPASQRSNW